MASSESLGLAHREFQNGLLSNNFHKAIQVFMEELARGDDPQRKTEALWHIAEGYHRMAHYQEAWAYWSRLAKELPQGSLARAAKVALAEALFQSRELEQALELLDVLAQELEEKRDMAWAFFRRGDCLFWLGDKKEAVLWYERAKGLNPPWGSVPTESLENMARMALDRADFPQASFMSMTALGLYPQHPRSSSWMLILARAMRLQSKSFQAGLLLEKLLDGEGQCRERDLASLMLMSLGAPCGKQPALFRVGSGQDSLEKLKAIVLAHQPWDRDLQAALGELAECWTSSERPVEAWELLESFQRGLQEDFIWPELRKATWKTGTALVASSAESGRPEMALEAFHWMLERIPGVWNEPGLLLSAARAHEALGFFATAADLYGRARVLVGPGGQAREAALGLIRSHLAAGRLEEAFRALHQEPSLTPSKGKEAAILEWARQVSSPTGFHLAARFLEETSRGKPTAETSKSLGLLSLETKICAPAVELLGWGLEALEDQGSSFAAEAQVLMGELLSCTGKHQEAARWYEKVAGHSEWGDTEKWAALRLVQLRAADNNGSSVLPYLERLRREPPGSPWRVLAEEFKQGKQQGEIHSRRGSS